MRVSLFGGFRIATADGDEVLISGKRRRDLLALLCLGPGEAFEREQLSALLWRGRYRAQARASLRQTLLDLNKLLTPIHSDAFEVSRESVAIRVSAVCTDLGELETALGEGEHAQAAELLRTIGSQALLEGIDLGEASAQWIEGRRELAEQRLQRGVERLLEQLLERGDERSYAELLEAWRPREAAAQVSVQQPQARVGVMPFRFVEADGTQAHVAQGLFDELITRLGKMPSLLVCGRNSSLNLAPLQLPLPEMARALRVAHLVQGSVQRQGDEVRVHVSLVDCSNGFETWSHCYRGRVDDVFALQEDIARAVAREVCSALGLDHASTQARRAAPEGAAYDLYLQGRALTVRAIGEGVLGKAVELLEASLRIDPRFAAGWTALAEALTYTAVFTPCLDRLEKARRMAECAEKAIALDPLQGHARAMLGIHRWTLNDPTGALDLAFEAYRLEPQNPDVVLRLGAFLLYIGRTREALPYIEAAIEQDPVHGRSFAMLAVARLNSGDLSGAVDAGRRMVDLGMPSMWLAVATAALGDPERAISLYRDTRHLMNTVIFPPAGTEPLAGDALEQYWTVAARGVCSQQASDRAIYCAVLDHLHATLPDPGDTSVVLPAIWMGYAEMVFKTLGQQITPANMYCMMSMWADIEPIRQIRLHPQFLDFAQRIGLRAAWDKYGWPDLMPVPEPSLSQRSRRHA